MSKFLILYNAFNKVWDTIPKDSVNKEEITEMYTIKAGFNRSCSEINVVAMEQYLHRLSEFQTPRIPD